MSIIVNLLAGGADRLRDVRVFGFLLAIAFSTQSPGRSEDQQETSTDAQSVPVVVLRKPDLQQCRVTRMTTKTIGMETFLKRSNHSTNDGLF